MVVHGNEGEVTNKLLLQDAKAKDITLVDYTPPVFCLLETIRELRLPFGVPWKHNTVSHPTRIHSVQLISGQQ